MPLKWTLFASTPAFSAKLAREKRHLTPVRKCHKANRMGTVVGLIDYGMGNLRSVQNALEKLGASVFIAREGGDLAKADRLVLPGVGAFGDAMANLHARGWVEPMAHFALSEQKPFIGICLGMQLLAERGTEYGEHRGLGWLPGAVLKLDRPGARIPHMGWNDVRAVNKSGLLRDLGDGASCYFVHSYAFVPSDPAIVSGLTDYAGKDFVSVVERGNLVGAQFHPEKSQKHGLAILQRFLEL